MTSLGITRSFPRLYPIMGLVTVALLTLAPLALRPVRLACLIHAANVHSEPGSNPSKWSRTASAPRRRRPPRRPSLEGLRISNWSQPGPVAARPPKAVPSPHSIAGPCCPSRRHRDLRTAEATASRDDGSHAGFPQGFLTCATDEGSTSSLASSICFASRFLADECNRPNCQRAYSGNDSIHVAASPKVQTFSRSRATSRLDVAASSKVRSSPPIPSAGASCLLRHLAPAVSINYPNLGDARTMISQSPTYGQHPRSANFRGMLHRP